jgi:hypothetical protein
MNQNYSTTTKETWTCTKSNNFWGLIQQTGGFDQHQILKETGGPQISTH